MKAEFDAKQRDLDAKQAVLAKRKAELEAQKSTLSAADYQQGTEQLQAELIKLQSTCTDYQKQLNDHQKDETNRVFEHAKSVLPAVAAARRVTVIYAKASNDWVWAPKGIDGNGDTERLKPRIDVTADVIRALDADTR